MVRKVSAASASNASETADGLGGEGRSQRPGGGGMRDPWLVQLGVANLTPPQVVAVVERRV